MVKNHGPPKGRISMILYMHYVDSGVWFSKHSANGAYNEEPVPTTWRVPLRFQRRVFSPALPNG